MRTSPTHSTYAAVAIVQQSATRAKINEHQDLKSIAAAHAPGMLALARVAGVGGNAKGTVCDINE